MSRINIPDSELWAHGGNKDKPDSNRFEKGNESGATATPPKHSDHNYEMNRADQNIQFILRNAKLPWNETENYPIDAVVYQGNKEYKAKTANTGKNPAVSPEDWEWIDNDNLPIASTSEAGIVSLTNTNKKENLSDGRDPSKVATTLTALDLTTKIAEAAMPAYVKSVSNDDWDSLINPGGYSVVGATGDNRPPAYTYGSLLVIATGSTVVQIYYTDQSRQVLSRNMWKTNGTWSEWEVIGGTANSPSSAQNLGGSDLNDFDGNNSYKYGEFGFFYQDVTDSAKPSRNYPEQAPGSLLVTKSAMKDGYGCIQTYTTFSGNVYTRSRYSSWSDWVKMYSTKNPPTPGDINALTGVTASQNMRDTGKWIRIADVLLPHSSSTAKISICGGAGFNGGTNYQSAEHRVIVRGGNKVGDANGTLYTDDLRGCPFSDIGWVYAGSNTFRIYALSRAEYSLGCLFEYTASSSNIVPYNEVQESEPSDLVKGAVVKMYTSEQPQSIDDIAGLEHVGKAVVGTSVQANDVSDSYVEFYDYGADDFDLVSFDPSQYETHIYHTGYYLVDVEVVRDETGASAGNGINAFVMQNSVQLIHGFVAKEDTDKRNPIRMRRVAKLYSGDKIKVYTDKDGEWIQGGSIGFQYLRPLTTSTKQTKDK